MLQVIYSDEFLDHKTGIYHPEKPSRLTAIVDALKTASFAEKITWKLPTPVISKPSLMSWIESVHSTTYINKVKNIATNGGGYLDRDTPVSPRSYDVALLAVSAWLDAVDTVINTADPAFVLARPPGHHAVSDTGMGFCLFSNAAIAAFYALQQPGIKRVAILDWDVHHGNGTEAIVATHPQIAYISLHQYPAYPGTGDASQQGLHNNVLNLPISPGSDITVYQPLWEKHILPFLNNFSPDLLIVSAGYDANANDPLASVNLQPEDFSLFTEYCLSITRKIMFGLEGGYDLPSLAKSVIATIQACIS
ncbi:histone deacetylase [Dolichospermum circinale CS-1225]|uniref:Histone deacetylase n=1 Tax=Dolichospermum circinale CS-537/01 TaxID=3021739 RepID=A0ABT5A5C8_9CYAN|nr:histone deacetylase [Dolichospermum circinale]MDB9460098.1 histone deacetylase [Dolichospermum circinale CS-545/17]MDB9468593.1 histone deacetylase [Dolichospermum circinale CS-539/09]MDB9469430.1 histone deacetylase [Dolichospermum circinale CS-539]MDB9486720.1 histone deacetylase [Dolichospermum circinale CS-537/01]MDB9520879.1 histone deacetylase [Dolichospermum circinale CS-1225]